MCLFNNDATQSSAVHQRMTQACGTPGIATKCFRCAEQDAQTFVAHNSPGGGYIVFAAHFIIVDGSVWVLSLEMVLYFLLPVVYASGPQNVEIRLYAR